MGYLASSTKERLNELQKNPLFFCKLNTRNYRKDATEDVWSSCDSTIDITIKRDNDYPQNYKRLFVILEQYLTNGAIDEKKEDKDKVQFEVEEFDTTNENHWLLVLNDCAYNFNCGNHQYCHLTLFWALYSTAWRKEIIEIALSKLPQESSQIICNTTSPYLYVFSAYQQRSLIELFKFINPNIRPLECPDVEAALRELSPSTDFRTFGFYKKIDYILSFGKDNDEEKHLFNLYRTSLNSLIHFKFWMEHLGRKFFNYDVLELIFSYVDSDTQISIINRYIEDVRLKLIEVDYTLIQRLRDCRYQQTVDIRNFIFNPSDSINLAAPMYCDTILTLKNSDGLRMQDFNGILDFAVRHSNRAYPKIDLGIKQFLPTCDGGLLHNSSFLGFIHYSIEYTLDPSLLTEERLKATATYLLDKYATKLYHYCCTNDNNNEVATDILEKCCRVNRTIKVAISYGQQINEIKKDACSSLQKLPITPYIWEVNTDKDVLGIFVDNIESKQHISETDINIEKLKEFIIKWSAQKHSIIFWNGNLSQYLLKKPVADHFVRTYYHPGSMTIYPNKCMFYSSKKSLLGVWSNDPKNIVHEEVIQQEEAPIVFANTFASLKRMYPNAEVGDDYIRLPYSEDELQKIKDYYHYKRHEYDPEKEYSDTNIQLRVFLTPRIQYGTFYCTPKVADSREKVSNLPFFWCRSDECFCNMLDNQTLAQQRDWRQYSIYHTAEILGFNLLQVTEKGNIPIEAVSNFASEVVQAEKMYSRLVCRSCGHMIFSTRGTILQGSRFFKCRNTQCSMLDEEIYLSQCNHCKKGLIDSRDSKKCENGWVICPSCLACCNDDLFDQLIARHRRNGRVPQRLLDSQGQGHNNKGIFYCPKCGTQLGDIIEETILKKEDGSEEKVTYTNLGCPVCKKTYNDELAKYRFIR